MASEILKGGSGVNSFTELRTDVPYVPKFLEFVHFHFHNKTNLGKESFRHLYKKHHYLNA